MNAAAYSDRNLPVSLATLFGELASLGLALFDAADGWEFEGDGSREAAISAIDEVLNLASRLRAKRQELLGGQGAIHGAGQGGSA